MCADDVLDVFVGLDYHMKSIQVCVVDEAGRVLANRRCPNSVTEVAKSVRRFGSIRQLAIESCTGAADFADSLGHATGWSIVLAHPGYVNRMRHNPDKSDYSDARMLAELCRSGFLPRVWLAPSYIRELRSLVRYRQQCVQQRRSVKVRILAVLRDNRVPEPDFGRWTKMWFAWLDSTDELDPSRRWIISRHLEQLASATRELREVEAKLREVTAHDQMIVRLLGEPGIGPVTAWTLRAEVGRFDRFRSGKQLSRFCALSPRNASSGQRMADSGLIHAGNGQLKATLIQAAHRLCRHDPRWGELAHRLRAQGKPTCVAVAAVANRWVRGLFYRFADAA